MPLGTPGAGRNIGVGVALGGLEELALIQSVEVAGVDLGEAHVVANAGIAGRVAWYMAPLASGSAGDVVVSLSEQAGTCMVHLYQVAGMQQPGQVVSSDSSITPGLELVVDLPVGECVAISVASALMGGGQPPMQPEGVDVDYTAGFFLDYEAAGSRRFDGQAQPGHAISWSGTHSNAQGVAVVVR